MKAPERKRIRLQQRRLRDPSYRAAAQLDPDLRRQDPPPTERRPAVQPALVAAWRRAAEVTPQAVEGHIPTTATLQVGEALLSGKTSVRDIVDLTGLTEEEARGVLLDPTAMAWISRQVYYFFQHRAALVDATLYHRAMAGDIPAIKLFYERMRMLVQDQTIRHVYSGEVNLKQLNVDELQQLVADKSRLLNATGVIIDVTPGSRDPVPGAEGAGDEAPEGAAAVLPADADTPPEAAPLPRQGEDAPAPPLPGGEPVGQDDGGCP